MKKIILILLLSICFTYTYTDYGINYEINNQLTLPEQKGWSITIGMLIIHPSGDIQYKDRIITNDVEIYHALKEVLNLK